MELSMIIHEGLNALWKVEQLNLLQAKFPDSS